MTDRSCLAIVLAAGEGTRMRSKLPKVLHEIGARPMVAHAVATARAAGADAVAVVVGPGHDKVAEVAGRAGAGETFVQSERRGTAHAVLCARAALERGPDTAIVLYGDTPLVRPATIGRVREALAAGADVVVLGFQASDPTGYGRLILRDGTLEAIREERDATPAERAVDLCNSGIMGFRGSVALALLEAIGDANAKGEYYLTDAVEIARARGLATAVVIGGEDEFLGVNDRVQLATCEGVFQKRRRAEALAAGVTLVAPDSVIFAADTEIAGDVVIEPNVVFGPGVTVASGARIRAFSHLEGATVGEGAIVGPYARLRPGAWLGRDVHVGNFVEIKNGRVEDGAKVNHLTYIGDARIGAKANIGAGTITCNYDGFGKYHTDIGAGAFVGSNASLVAPVAIGDGAWVGSGSVVTKDVPADALVVARAHMIVRPGWASAFRARKAAERAAKK
ncbi:bifunctional UDP-N-acetylglucosamine diphosphorylase/glucosamine-1-phosphate N-acetyltransferase GlmU [Siculibacillus lacustris]|uniref:Bifunctional protein GlmU n=1 Tax=Siculibacillus lacustris TaxID=1549641 RepID=A0A4Q9VMY6_9HYPH|nr:bifunctional UDP-N-acetylglucosamine diphosphorylase/glucosamine-1-phosphate N-acetyltransferase GlmU [Siculibacillus lacustris]TBW36969.1 bifunctional UDP-N-acetylglucosamine diphosphorylase/glucosamine-1-phosphate N-acetyltransferase GlmU [Siculibacillus lacustris]